VADYDDTTYPGVEALAGYASDTEFVLQTTGSPVPPHIEGASRMGNSIHFEVVGDPQRGYAIEATDDPASSTGWLPVWSQYTDNQGRYSYEDQIFPGQPRRFYRVREMTTEEL